ncbi:hypothetical protein THASP1DRAFT_28913 [Thamnocephalis sphaerospora]|uniref:Uncharacterized protein n=1 Tax=Thamnocephalis sphaerospora TaxID=78915 RepID=A0A4P9XT06_9FUNG|nr:hypothetical protein THASP1DRAFT_28913 [Thamnocephalis sphaerospora]|eukprot:RKP09288.1 hypothetical protein THASP1DRAFT_28913 [Thamnocephalis sphaerospora]
MLVGTGATTRNVPIAVANNLLWGKHLTDTSMPVSNWKASPDANGTQIMANDVVASTIWTIRPPTDWKFAPSAASSSSTKPAFSSTGMDIALTNVETDPNITLDIIVQVFVIPDSRAFDETQSQGRVFDLSAIGASSRLVGLWWKWVSLGVRYRYAEQDGVEVASVDLRTAEVPIATNRDYRIRLSVENDVASDNSGYNVNKTYNRTTFNWADLLGSIFGIPALCLVLYTVLFSRRAPSNGTSQQYVPDSNTPQHSPPIANKRFPKQRHHWLSVSSGSTRDLHNLHEKNAMPHANYATVNPAERWPTMPTATFHAATREAHYYPQYQSPTNRTPRTVEKANYGNHMADPPATIKSPSAQWNPIGSIVPQSSHTAVGQQTGELPKIRCDTRGDAKPHAKRTSLGQSTIKPPVEQWDSLSTITPTSRMSLSQATIRTTATAISNARTEHIADLGNQSSHQPSNETHFLLMDPYGDGKRPPR